MNMPQGPGGPHGYPGPGPQGQPGQPGPGHQDPPPRGPYQGGPPPGFQGAPTTQFAPAAPSAPASRAHTAIWTLGLISLAATVLGLTLDENGNNAWRSVHAWGGLAIAGAALTLTPALARSFNLAPSRAWQIAACGAGALVLFWVLFVLPAVGSNTSLVTTVGAAAGVIAVWIAPGRESTPPGGPGPQGHTW